MTRFTHGAITPLTVEHYTERELVEYLTAMDEYNREVAASYGR